jgi:hypothetical protein
MRNPDFVYDHENGSITSDDRFGVVEMVEKREAYYRW